MFAELLAVIEGIVNAFIGLWNNFVDVLGLGWMLDEVDL